MDQIVQAIITIAAMALSGVFAGFITYNRKRVETGAKYSKVTMRATVCVGILVGIVAWIGGYRFDLEPESMQASIAYLGGMILTNIGAVGIAEDVLRTIGVNFPKLFGWVDDE